MASLVDRLPMTFGIMCAIVGFGIAYAIVVPHGLPYDEPSHWQTTLYYADHWSMPKLGNPGITYTAEHPPLAYWVGAIVVRVTRVIGLSPNDQFVAVRMVFGLELIASVMVLDRILRRLFFDKPARFVGIMLFGLAPISLAMFWSIQNDGLLILIALVAVVLALRWSAINGRVEHHWQVAVIGGTVGLAMLTRITAFWLVIALAFWFAWPLVSRAIHSGPGENAWPISQPPSAKTVLEQVAIYAITVGVVCGWWFVHNLVVYGVLTPDRSHTGLPPAAGVGFDGPRTVAHAVGGVVTYLWVPTEYWRNVIRLAPPVKALLIVGTAVLVAAAVRGAAGRSVGDTRAIRCVRRALNVPPADGEARAGLGVFVIPGILCVVALIGWFVLHVWVASFPARIGALGLVILSGVGGALALDRVSPRRTTMIAVACGIVLCGLSMWLIFGAADRAGLSAVLLRGPS